MNKLKNEFVSKEEVQYKFKIGKAIASSLSGFLAGLVVGVIGVMAVVFLWLVQSLIIII